MTNSKKKNRGCLSTILGFWKSDDPTITYSPADEMSELKRPLPFRLRDDFLSTAEHSFYLVLKSMMGSYFTICPKVSLSDIFYVIQPNENSGFYNKINRKHVDFLICDTDTMKPRFAIELDDKSHNRQDRMDRDEFVEELFETANLPLVRIPVRPTYNTNELGVFFREALQIGQQTSGQNSASFGTGKNVPVEIPQSVKTAPLCPKCGQQMVLRTSQNGTNKGNSFFGCVNYPKCKMIVPIN
jgi:predicted RNA-binding Zn-ribbon protein involved in translation (DUF1610 family)